MRTLNPVFLLGPGRSGTTLLYKVLCMHPAAAFISNYDIHRVSRPFASLAFRLASADPAVRRWAWFTESGAANFTDRSISRRFIPTPNEGEPVYRGCGLSLQEFLGPVDQLTRARLRGTFERIQYERRASALFLKRTANNRRIPALDSAFPEAKYVLIWRDGRAVASSLINVDWWLDHRVWWANWQTPREMNLSRQGMIDLAARNWIEEAAAIERGIGSIQQDRVLTIRYENMLQAPQQTIQKVLDFIDLDAPPSYMAEVRKLGLRPDSGKWKSFLTPPELARVEQLTCSTLKRLSYISD